MTDTVNANYFGNKPFFAEEHICIFRVVAVIICLFFLAFLFLVIYSFMPKGI